MKINLSADVYEDAGVIDLTLYLSENMPNFFLTRQYGNSDVEIFIVINCIPYDFKLRKRYDSKEKVLCYDIMLDYETIKKAPKSIQKSILAKSIIDSFDHLDKYKKLNIDKTKLKEDTSEFFIKLKWLESSLSMAPVSLRSIPSLDQVDLNSKKSRAIRRRR